ncbi:MAG: hypothetical protein DDT33_00887 [Firmicutes bacterium]|nr:hypothetical protein [Bacillota bacterium]
MVGVCRSLIFLPDLRDDSFFMHDTLYTLMVDPFKFTLAFSRLLSLYCLSHLYVAVSIVGGTVNIPDVTLV